MKRYSSSRDDREEKMQVELRIRNTDLSTVLRNYAERRLRFALSRFGDRAGRVLVTVSGLDSADQGIATNCDISAEVRPFGQVTARETGRDLYAAIDRAAGRLGRLFTTRLDRVEDEGQGRVSLLTARLEGTKRRYPAKNRDGCCDITPWKDASGRTGSSSRNRQKVSVQKKATIRRQ
jgi:putative sigma-54 modulation protein